MDSSNKKVQETINKLDLKVNKVRVFGVDYLYLETPEKGDLYVTELGILFLEHLLPSNWNDKEYYEKPENQQFKQNLSGSGHPYKIATKPVDGKSINIVVKFCRFGQDVSAYKTSMADFVSDEEILNAMWDNPFEKFSMVMDLRKNSKTIHTKKPLAIYVHPEKVELGRTDRKEWIWQRHVKLLEKDQEKSQFEHVELDIHRIYTVIYSWEEGINAFEKLGLDKEELTNFVKKVNTDLNKRGYKMLDLKPQHLILRINGEKLLRDKEGNIAYTLVDYGLLTKI